MFKARHISVSWIDGKPLFILCRELLAFINFRGGSTAANDPEYGNA